MSKLHPNDPRDLLSHPICRSDEKGYRQVCLPDGRRGLWLRFSFPRDETGKVIDTIIELCAGREGDDAYAWISKNEAETAFEASGDKNWRLLFRALKSVFSHVYYAQDVAYGDGVNKFVQEHRDKLNDLGAKEAAKMFYEEYQKWEKEQPPVELSYKEYRKLVQIAGRAADMSLKEGT